MANIRETFDLVAFKQGDGKIFSALFDTYKDPIYFYCLRITRDEWKAEEATIIAFEKLWEARDRLEDRNHLIRLLYVAARSQSLNLISKKPAGHIIYTDPAELAEQPKGQELPTDKEILSAELARQNQWELVLDELNQLPSLYKQVLSMRFLEGISVEEIARLLGKTPKQISDTIFSAKQAIRKKLGGKGPSHPELIILLTILKVF